jgi:hypothetical protein
LLSPSRRAWARRPPRRQSFAEAKQKSIQTYLFAVLAYFVLVCALILPIGNLLSLGFTFEVNYNEGWNVYNADRLIHGELIYDNNYWRVNNYPIGSFLIIAAANVLFRDLLLSGRLVALASFGAIGVFAAIATRRFGGGRTDAVFGAGCAMGFCYLVAPAWINADDPQTLGEAVMLGALVSYIGRPPDRLNLLRTAFLVVCGGFIKHNVLAIPAAITVDLAIRSPRRLLLWLASCAGLATGFVALTQLVAGGNFVDHLLSPRIFSWYGARYHLMKYLRLFKFSLAAIALSASLVLTADRMIFAVWGMISIISATILSGFEGTSYNMFQDAAVFLGIAAGVTMSELRKLDSSSRFASILATILPFVVAQPILTRVPDVAAQVYHGRALLDSASKRFSWPMPNMLRTDTGRQFAKVCFFAISQASLLFWIHSTRGNTCCPAGSTKANLLGASLPTNLPSSSFAPISVTIRQHSPAISSIIGKRSIVSPTKCSTPSIIITKWGGAPPLAPFMSQNSS